jgi:predicted RNA binding protein YcfA (HicA-like mRNA interferase family)
MAKKIRELIQELVEAGFYEIKGGKGSHRKYTHVLYPGAVTGSPYKTMQVIKKCLCKHE